MEDNPALDDYILGLSSANCPAICFVPTASGDSPGYILDFYRRFRGANCRATDLGLFRRKVADLEAFACSQDVIYVGGGNTADMLAIWRVHGFDRALRKALSGGTVLAGISAGSICWFQSGVTDSFGAELRGMDCLGFLEGSNCPHYDGEVMRRPAYQRLVGEGMPAGYGAEDGAGLHFIDGVLERVVASQPGATAYRVEMLDGEVRETALEAVQL
jgi:peptidase E